MTTTMAALPTVFVSHGGGPSWLLDGRNPGWERMQAMDMNSGSGRYIKTCRQSANLPRHPKAILVISAHWDEATFTLLSKPSPGLLFDYYGFPEHTYHVKYAAPGAPDTAERTSKLLESSGIKFLVDKQRDFDHGTFIPMMFIYPEADVPIFQISLKSSFGIEEHLQLGEALQQLRKEGVLIVGSGFTTHSFNESFTGRGAPAWFTTFVKLINDILVNPSYSAADRKTKLIGLEKEESYHKAHPTADHFLPLVVACAAAGYVPATMLYEETINDCVMISHFKFE